MTQRQQWKGGRVPDEAGNSPRFLSIRCPRGWGLLRRLSLGRVRDRNLQRFVTEQPPYSILVRGIEANVLPTCARHGMAVMSYSPLAGGWLSGRWRKDTGQQSSSRAGRLPERFDLSNPYNQRKLDAVEQLAQLAEQAGLTLIQLALAFAKAHPAVTSPLIGPRTMDQLRTQLAALDVVLIGDMLDRIDEIVAPGTTINPADSSFANPALKAEVRRRPHQH